jgi:endonuclease YncB( thermonuclease family)
MARIVSILLGIVVVLLGNAMMVFVLWPVTIPIGFGEVWRAKQAQSRPETPPLAARESPQPTNGPEPATHAVLPAETSPKPAELTQDKSSAERLATLKDKDKTGAIASQAATKRYFRLSVRDGATLQSSGTVIRLAGIVARAADATCKSADGKAWQCGASAKVALARLIHGRAVTCKLPKGGEQREFVARCAVAGADLSTWMVRNGWADPKDAHDPALEAAATAAKQEKLGLWRGAE